jgi:formylglycine-generating enzyme required for sulfatase activity
MESMENAKSQAKKADENRRILWIAIAVLIMVVIILVVMFSNSEEPEATPLELSPRQIDVHVNSLGMKFVYVPPGEFVMGSNDSDDEKPAHKVKISQGFLMGMHEITRRQFGRFVKNTGYKTDAERESWSYVLRGSLLAKVDGISWQNLGFEQTDDHPVVFASWNDAETFCDWLSQTEGRTYRLPTEAEWEYACRAGTATICQWGNNPDNGSGWCNAADLTAKPSFSEWETMFNWRDGYIYTSPVGQFRQNLFGLFDMHGNVWEWCSDWYDNKYYANSPPSIRKDHPQARTVLIAAALGPAIQGPYVQRLAAQVKPTSEAPA